MSLIKKIFGSGSGNSAPAELEASTAAPSSSGDDARARSTSRRELVHSVLRETIRAHGIPSDWIGCRVLSVVSRSTNRAGVHVQFIVYKGADQLLAYVQQFQQSFWQGMDRADPYARQWIFSLAWQFEGLTPGGAKVAGPIAANSSAIPVISIIDDDDETQPPEAGDTLPQDNDAVDLESDLAALYAIRDAAIARTGPGALPDHDATVPEYRKPG